MKTTDLLHNGTTVVMLTAEQLKDFASEIIRQAKDELHQPTQGELYTPKEFAARHRVDVSTLWRWVQNGTLKKTMVGGKVFYRDSDLQIKEG